MGNTFARLVYNYIPYLELWFISVRVLLYSCHGQRWRNYDFWFFNIKYVNDFHLHNVNFIDTVRLKLEWSIFPIIHVYKLFMLLSLSIVFENDFFLKSIFFHSWLMGFFSFWMSHLTILYTRHSIHHFTKPETSPPQNDLKFCIHLLVTVVRIFWKFQVTHPPGSQIMAFLSFPYFWCIRVSPIRRLSIKSEHFLR